MKDERRNETENPVGHIEIEWRARQRPASDVVAKQDPGHTQADFLSDLDRATRRTEERPS